MPFLAMPLFEQTTICSPSISKEYLSVQVDTQAVGHGEQPHHVGQSSWWNK